jgi:hypothetical protein
MAGYDILMIVVLAGTTLWGAFQRCCLAIGRAGILGR